MKNFLPADSTKRDASMTHDQLIEKICSECSVETAELLLNIADGLTRPSDLPRDGRLFRAKEILQKRLEEKK
jgi:hypothetical protein